MEEREAVVGVVRRRRDLSKHLVFLDLEMDPPQEGLLQLVCEWLEEEVPKNIVAGVQVRAMGMWDERGRWAVTTQQLTVLADLRGDSPWENAAIAKSIRCQHRPRHADAWNNRWEERKMEKLEKRRLAGVKSIEEHECNGSTKTYDCTEHTDAAAHHVKDKNKHNIVFVQWLLDNFGKERLKLTEVCDIAGGRGQIALELSLSYDISTVLIEPKPLNLNSSYRKRVKKWRKRKISESERDSSLLMSENEIIPPLQSAKFTNLQNSQEFQKACENLEPLLHIQEEFHGITEEANSDAIVQAISNSGLILAMHPDQAIGAVLETALAKDKPFAIVPCCVFARQNPHRLTPSGNTVSTYEELCDWIQAQDSNICRASLPFQGRNIVLYKF